MFYFCITKILKIKEIRNFFFVFFIINLIQPTGINNFAVQTRRAELVEQRLMEIERVQARAKLQETEKNHPRACRQQLSRPQDTH